MSLFKHEEGPFVTDSCINEDLAKRFALASTMGYEMPGKPLSSL